MYTASPPHLSSARSDHFLGSLEPSLQAQEGRFRHAHCSLPEHLRQAELHLNRDLIILGLSQPPKSGMRSVFGLRYGTKLVLAKQVRCVRHLMLILCCSHNQAFASFTEKYDLAYTLWLLQAALEAEWTRLAAGDSTGGAPADAEGDVAMAAADLVSALESQVGPGQQAADLGMSMQQHEEEGTPPLRVQACATSDSDVDIGGTPPSPPPLPPPQNQARSGCGCWKAHCSRHRDQAASPYSSKHGESGAGQRQASGAHEGCYDSIQCTHKPACVSATG